MKGSIGGLSGESDSSCDDVDSSTGSETCSDDQYRCIYANVEVTVKQVFASTTLTVQYRGCADTFSNGCHSASTSDLKGPAKILAELSPADVSGTACFCDSDMCDEVYRGDGCVAVWVLVVIGIVAVASVVGFSICLCKCCSRSSRGAIVHVPQPAVSIIQPLNTGYPAQAAGVNTVYPVLAAGVNTGYPVLAAGVNTGYPAQAAGVNTVNPVQAAGVNTGYPVQAAGPNGGVDNPTYMACV
ncbi:hypothetical protein LSAT2_028548 [Lamellibrachia satsuma]|nr:hypothetical protein LSAT2_028548 [Lamellibrachia satsuma]